MPGGFFQLWFAVRYVHVASVAVLAGGALLIALACAAESSGDSRLLVLPIAVVYEWMFWSVVGVTAATGVSNLGLKGEGLLGPETGWGAALTIKLTVVLGLLCVSLVRSDVVLRARRAAQSASARVRVVFAAMYGATALAMLGVAWIGLGLAHGRY